MQSPALPCGNLHLSREWSRLWSSGISPVSCGDGQGGKTGITESRVLGLKATQRQPCQGWDTATTPGCSRSPSPSLLEELWALGSCTSILWEPPPLQAGQSHLSPWVSGTLGVSLCQPRDVTVLSPCPQSSRSPALLPLFPLFPVFPDSPSPVPVAGAAPGTAPAGSIFLQALQISIFPCRGKEPGSQTAGGDKQGQ